MSLERNGDKKTRNIFVSTVGVLSEKPTVRTTTAFDASELHKPNSMQNLSNKAVCAGYVAFLSTISHRGRTTITSQENFVAYYIVTVT
jgi:hypothetical protein